MFQTLVPDVSKKNWVIGQSMSGMNRSSNVSKPVLPFSPLPDVTSITGFPADWTERRSDFSPKCPESIEVHTEIPFADLFLNPHKLPCEWHYAAESTTLGLGAYVKLQVFQNLRLRPPHSPSGFYESYNPQLNADNSLKGYNSSGGSSYIS